jgi:small subunit ribosomal protein S1
LADGIEGLVHVSEISPDKRINHPQDVLRVGQVVKAQVLAIDLEKRQVKLSIKQLIPSHIDEYIAEHKTGDVVSGRVVEQSATLAHVELGDGIRAICRTAFATPSQAPSAANAPPRLEFKPEPIPPAKPDLSSLGSMLKARWKGSAPASRSKPQPLGEGQVRSFKIVKLDPEAKKIEVELA